MPKAISIEMTGGPEVLRWVDVPLPQPEPGQVLLRHTAIGVNFIDVYHRTGFYPLPLPFTVGLEGVGVVEKLGEGVQGLGIGQRVAYGKGVPGAYAEYRAIAADHVITVPEGLDDTVVAGAMLKGLTAHFLLHLAYQVSRGTVVLVHAAAGGVGSLLCQWANHLGATVIGTVGDEEKAHHALRHGCQHVILYRQENMVERVKEITKGAMCDVVYDGVGKTTFDGSLDALRPRGMMVSFGQASGPVPPFEITTLARKGSLFLTRPTLNDYAKDRGEYERAATKLLTLIAQGVLKVHIGQTYPLSQAAEAHRDLEDKKTRGSTVLLP